VLISLDERFDTHLAQAENLTSLFVAIYDGVGVSCDGHVTIM
jgi:FKBP12-rapamycin complex-associated protein